MDTIKSTTPKYRRISFYGIDDANILMDSLKQGEVRRVDALVKHALGEGWPEYLDLSKRRVDKIAKDLGIRAMIEIDEQYAQQLFAAQQALLEPVDRE